MRLSQGLLSPRIEFTFPFRSSNRHFSNAPYISTAGLHQLMI